MANIKSQKKRNKTNELRRQRNMTRRSRMKTMVKQVDAAIESKDADGLKKALPVALSSIDKAASKGVIHKNQAARRKSALERRAASI